MPQLPFPAELRALLLEPNPAVVATLRSDGAPVSVATWYLLEDDDRILLNMDLTRVRVKHLQRDPRLSLTVLDDKNWYTHVSMVGTVVEQYDDVDLADINRISEHYTGRRYQDQQSPRVSARMVVDRWHGWRGGRGITVD